MDSAHSDAHRAARHTMGDHPGGGLPDAAQQVHHAEGGAPPQGEGRGRPAADCGTTGGGSPSQRTAPPPPEPVTEQGVRHRDSGGFPDGALRGHSEATALSPWHGVPPRTDDPLTSSNADRLAGTRMGLADINSQKFIGVITIITIIQS